MKFKKLSMLAAGLLAFSQANALVIQVDVDNVDIFLNDNMVTAVDSITQIDLWDFNSSTFVFNGYDDASYTLFDIDDHSSIGISGSSGSLNGSSISYTVVSSIGGSVLDSGAFNHWAVGTVVSDSIIYGTLVAVDSGSVIYGSVGTVNLGGDDIVNVIDPDFVQIDVSNNVTSVPEPSVLALLSIGLLAMFGFRRRSKQ